MGMEVRGWEETEKGFRKLREKLEDAAQEGVNRSTDLLMSESQIQVPKKTGKLAESAEFVDHSNSGPKRSRGVKYGRTALNDQGESYAAAVHEILKASHKSPTKAKYVEAPLVESIKRYAGYTATACRRAVRKSFR